MRFLLDENAELRLARFLRDRGHDVTAIVRDYPTSLPDEEVLALAERESRILLTNDRDFERHVLQRGRPHSGIIFFRLPQGRIDLKLERLAYVLDAYAGQLGQFLEVTEYEVVVRSPASP